MLGLLVNGISVGAVYALIAVGFALIFSVMKFSNFAHGGMIAASAYIGFFATRYLSLELFPMLLCAMLGGGVIGIFVEFIGFRRMRNQNSPLIYYFISSITIGVLLENVLTLINGTNFYMFPRFFERVSFDVAGFMVNILDIIMFCTSIVALLILLFIFKKTKLGLSIRAVSMDNGTARLMGVNSSRVVMAAFFITGCLAGICGVFLGINYTVYPQLSQMVVKGFIASVLGGLGSLGGAVAGAILLGVAEVFITVNFGASLTPVIIFLVMIVFLLVRPQGIAGVFVNEKV